MPRTRSAHPVQRGAQLGGQARHIGQISQQPRPGMRHDTNPSALTMILGRVVVACTSKIPLYWINLVLSKPSFSW